MAGSYRPRPPETKTCKHCGSTFESRHKRTIYCGSSCRTLAYNARHHIAESEPIKKPKGDLSFSFQNVGVAAAGAATAAVANYALNDRPAQQEILAKLATLDKELEVSLNEILRANQLQIDFITAMKQTDPLLEQRMKQVIEQRVLEAAKSAKQAIIKTKLVADMKQKRKRL